MNNDKQLDQLINVLYETALEPERWQEAMLLCARQVNCIAAHIMTVDKKLNKPVFLLAAGDGDLPAPENQINYVNYYVNVDPRMGIMDKTPAYEWQFCSSTMDQQFVNHNEFYQDFLIPSGGRYAMGMWVDDNPERKTVFGLHRAVGQDTFCENDLRDAERFTNHLQRAIKLQKYTQNLKEKAELGARAIDSFGLSMLIVDQSANILHLNSQAETLLKKRQAGLGCHNGRLSADSAQDNQKLASFITQATSYPAIGSAMFLKNSKVPQTRQLFISPLPAASPYVKDWQTPLALVLMMETSQSLSSMQLLGSLYNFSPAELKIAAALLQGKSGEEYAIETSVSLSTVRTQIKTLYRKTDTKGLSDLVGLLSRVPPLN